MAATNITRQENQPVYVLHTYPFKETSLVVELFSRDCGRIATVAKGARRPRSAMRGMLQSFQPLLGTWSGKLELKTLHSLEWSKGLLLLQGEAMMCGFYLNELLLRLLPREDAHEILFEYYSTTLHALAQGQNSATVLRRFELKMLQEMGYAVPLEYDTAGSKINALEEYYYLAEHGASKQNSQNGGMLISGGTLLNMAQDDYSDLQTQLQSKQLMRMLIAHYLGDKPLYTRQLLLDLQEI